MAILGHGHRRSIGWSVFHNLFRFVSLVSISLALFIAPISKSFADDRCASVVGQIAVADQSLFSHSESSLRAITKATLGWHALSELVRLVSGSAIAFNGAFFANAGIDTTASVMSHQISMGRVPDAVRRLFDVRSSYTKRAVLNTFMVMTIATPLWVLGAVDRGADVGSISAWVNNGVLNWSWYAGTIGFLAGSYRFAPYWKMWLFDKKPQQRDHQVYSQMQKSLVNELQALELAAREKVKSLGSLGMEEVVSIIREAEKYELGDAAPTSNEAAALRYQHLLMNLFEVMTSEIPFETRIAPDNTIRTGNLPVELQGREVLSAKFNLWRARKLMSTVETQASRLKLMREKLTSLAPETEDYAKARKSILKQQAKLRSNRNALIRKLISLYETGVFREEISNALYLGEPFSVESSMAFHQLMVSRNYTKFRQLTAYSIYDRLLWTGLFGTVVMRFFTEHIPAAGIHN